MHMYGVYTGRYGVSDTVLVDHMAPEIRADFEPVLGRQERWIDELKQRLAADPDTRWLAGETQIMKNYRQLQFFDQLALCFNFSHPEARGEAEFLQVPETAHETTTIRIQPIDRDRYGLEPFPFAAADIELSCQGRAMRPVAGGEREMQAVFEAASVEPQTIRLVRL